MSDDHNYRIYRNRTVVTDKTIHYNRSDIAFHNKVNKVLYLICIVIPNTQNIVTTLPVNLSKYQDLSNRN